MIMSIIPRESQLVGETFSENRDVKEAIETKWFSFKVDKFFMKHPIYTNVLYIWHKIAIQIASGIVPNVQTNK